MRVWGGWVGFLFGSLSLSKNKKENKKNKPKSCVERRRSYRWAVKGAAGDGHVEGHMSVDGTNFVYMLVNAAKELDARVQSLEEEVKALRAENKALRRER